MQSKKQLYESIMKSIAKQVKNALNESKEDEYPHEFSSDDFKEIKKYILEDEDFYEAFCNYGNYEYFDSYEDSVDDFINFLENDLYGMDSEDEDPHEVHAFYILDEPDMGTAWAELPSGKLLNCDNLYQEYKSVIKG